MTQIRLTSAVIVAGQHRNEGETIDVPSDLARSLIARGLAEPVSAARASASQPTLALDALPAPSLANVAKAFAEAGEHFARAAALSADPKDAMGTKDATDDDEDLGPLADPAASASADSAPTDLADPDTTRDSSDADKAPSEPAQPGEPETAPEGESSASSSRKRRRR